MKKILIMTMALVMASIAAVVSAATGSVTYNATYDYSRLTFGTATLDGVTYTTVGYEGLYNEGAPGTPSLPVDYIRFSVPWNATSFSVSAVLDDNQTEGVDYEIYPCQQFPGQQNVTLPDMTAYSCDSYFPSQSAWIDGEGMMAGENHVVTVAVMPISYLHSQADGIAPYRLKFSGTVRLTLSYELSDNPTMYPLIRNDNTLRNKGFEMTREMVVNPVDVMDNAYSSPLERPEKNPDQPQEPAGTPATYLIVATPQSLHPMRRLAALRRQKGIDVKLVTVNEAITDPLAGQGDSVNWGGTYHLTYTDDAGKLRQYLRKHYLTLGTENVMLAGTGVPFRWKNGSQADMYFSDLNLDWNYYFDNGAELIVGRLLGTSSSQFDNYTDKLFRYELNPGNGDRSYLEKSLYTLQEKYSGLEYVIEQIADYCCPDSTYLFASSNGISPTGNDVINAINTKHFNFISSFNDGTPSYIVPGADENYLWAIDTVKVAPSFIDSETGNGLNRMLNKYYPSIYFSSKGQTMPYIGVSGYNVDVNFGESFTMGKDYGGPVYMGLTLDYDDNGIMHLGDGLSFATINSYTLGMAYAAARKTIPYFYAEDIVSRHNYLGDPMIEMWNCVPQIYSGVTVTRTDNSISVAGVPVGAKVSYCDNSGNLGMQKATASSVTFNNVDPNSTVMVYDRSHLPHIAGLVLQNTTLDSSQYVIAEDVTIGRQVESTRTYGNVTVSDDASYEIEAAGKVTIQGGFKVELGSSFAVYPSTYK